MQDRNEKISMLIYKYILGHISAEEHRELDEWTQESRENRELLRRVSDSGFLEREYRRRKNVRTERALADMKRRIACGVPEHAAHRWVSGKKAWYMAAAVLLLAFGVFAFMRNAGHWGNDGPAAMAMNDYGLIRHGETRAVLTLGNGMAVELGADSVRNMEAIHGVTDIAGPVSARRDEPDDGLHSLNSLSLSVPRGGEFRFTLEDGTEVWLNAESQLVYPEKFDGNERCVELRGEAYFKVAKNAEKPFIVSCAGQEVRVTGTEFNVQCYKEEESVYTTLVNGGIALKPQNACSGELLLTPGHQVVLNKADSHADVRTVDTDVVTSWKEGRFVFEDQTLEQIIRMLSRWYDFTYEFKDEDVKHTLFMGSIPRYVGFDVVARILEASGGLRFEVDGKKLRIYKK